MIRSLAGEVLSVSEGAVVLDVNGLGFELLCSRAALGMCRQGERARLTTWLQISEAGASLYGFASERERELFLKVTMRKDMDLKMLDFNSHLSGETEVPEYAAAFLIGRKYADYGWTSEPREHLF